jgi:hypothetical protein
MDRVGVNPRPQLAFSNAHLKMPYPTLISHQQWTGIIMFWEKASRKSRKGKPSRIAAFDGVRLVGLFSIIILILLVAPIAAMGAPPQPPGRLVDAGGSVGINMHIYCTGEGNPTVVLDAGANGGTMSWAGVQEQVSNHT